MTNVDPNQPQTGSSPQTGSQAVGPDGDEGLRAWTAQLDRKLGTRTYAGAAAVVLALATAIVAVVLAIDARDNSAGAGDLSRVENRLSDLSAMAGAGESAQEDIDSLSKRLSSIENQLSGIADTDGDFEQRISVVEDDIDDLRGQISDLGGGESGTSGGVAPGDEGSPPDPGGSPPD